jgi:15-cis-phytoene synthase
MPLTTSTTHLKKTIAGGHASAAAHGHRSPAHAEAQQRALVASRLHCEQVTRRFAKNFYYGLKLLPEPKRSEMYALYAYMRKLDDIADAEDGRNHHQRVKDLEAWRTLTHQVLDGRLPHATTTSAATVAAPAAHAIHGNGNGNGNGSAHGNGNGNGNGVVNGHRVLHAAPGLPDIWPAFADLVHRRRIPRELFDAAIAGQHQDLGTPAFHTFDDLHKYCYRVAGVVGVASIYVWGFAGGAETEALAIKRGVAFQLTNILRDLRQDAEVGRAYLPREDLAAHGLTEQDVLTGTGGRPFVDLVRFQIARAERFYEESAPLDSRIEREARPTLFAMTAIYHALLKKISRDPERVLRERVSLSILDKLRIASRATRVR